MTGHEVSSVIIKILRSLMAERRMEVKPPAFVEMSPEAYAAYRERVFIDGFMRLPDAGVTAFGLEVKVSARCATPVSICIPTTYDGWR